MKKNLISAVVVSLVLCSIIVLINPSPLLGWGFWAHREINKMAIASLPGPLRQFFEQHADSIIARSVEPDLRRRWDKEEGFTHYIDIDRYGKYPFKDLPRSYDLAVRKFGKGFVDSNGTVPWRIVEFTKGLTKAFRDRDTAAIVFYASNLGHYVADAHVPLHTTENYDGQMTDQKGVHWRWESGIPERYGSTFHLVPQHAEFLADPLGAAFDAVLESYEKVDSVLSLDREALAQTPEKDRYVQKTVRGRVVNEYSGEYFRRYDRLLKGMVERQMNEAIDAVASYWYTAWVNAGKPEFWKQ